MVAREKVTEIRQSGADVRQETESFPGTAL
jgi:hypothetical protein